MKIGLFSVSNWRIKYYRNFVYTCNQLDLWLIQSEIAATMSSSFKRIFVNVFKNNFDDKYFLLLLYLVKQDVHNNKKKYHPEHLFRIYKYMQEGFLGYCFFHIVLFLESMYFQINFLLYTTKNLYYCCWVKNLVDYY